MQTRASTAGAPQSAFRLVFSLCRPHVSGITSKLVTFPSDVCSTTICVPF